MYAADRRPAVGGEWAHTVSPPSGLYLGGSVVRRMNEVTQR